MNNTVYQDFFGRERSNSMGQEDNRQLVLVNLPKENKHEENYVGPPAEKLLSL